VGDDLLVAVANRLRSAARTAETVGRYAGDEFVVICEDLEDDAGARLAAERLHREVARLVDLDGILVDVTMSVGVAVADRQETIEGLLERADRAMYQAKPPRPPASTADA
jgi:diguanylate cyclase (GGDEF)-like protein